MTRKLVNIKNVLRIIISLFVIANMVKSCAKALSSQDVIDYIDNTANYFSNNSNYQIIKNYINNSVAAKNWLSQYANEYNNFAIRTSYYQGAQTYTLKLFSSNNGKIQSNSNGLSYTGNYRQTLFRGNNQANNYTSTDYNASIDGGYCYSSNSNYENNLTGMAFITDEIVGTLPNTFVGNQAIPQFVYLEFLNTMDNTAYNGNLYTYYYQGDFYSNNQIKLGDIIPHDSYYFEVRLKDSKTEVIKGTSFVALNSAPYTFYNDGAIIINNNFEVFAIPRLLKYSNQYQLEIISYYGDGGNNLFEDLDWFIFLPENATISGDYITSLGSGDFTTQDSTNQIIDNQNQNNNEIISTINNIVGNLPAVSSGDASGDLSSGFDGGGGILGGIFSLFVPDGQFFKDYFEDLNNWFSDRLGLLYFPIELTIDFLTRCLNIDFTSQVLSIGPYVMPLNDNFELVPEIEIDFNSFLEDETVNSIHEIYLFITDGLIIFGLYRLIIKKYNNIVKNKGGG